MLKNKMEVLDIIKKKFSSSKTRRLEDITEETNATPESIRLYCAGLTMVRKDMQDKIERVYVSDTGSYYRKIIPKIDKIVLDLIAENYSVNQYLIARQKYEELLRELP